MICAGVCWWSLGPFGKMCSSVYVAHQHPEAPALAHSTLACGAPSSLAEKCACDPAEAFCHNWHATIRSVESTSAPLHAEHGGRVLPAAASDTVGTTTEPGSVYSPQHHIIIDFGPKCFDLNSCAFT